MLYHATQKKFRDLDPDDRARRIAAFNDSLQKAYVARNAGRAVTVINGWPGPNGECEDLEGATLVGVELVFDRRLHFNVTTDGPRGRVVSYVDDLADLVFKT